MIKSFLRDTLIPGYLRWTGKRHLLPLFHSLVHAGRPSETAFPGELLEQGLSIFLSGLNNTLAVQSNPGWVWGVQPLSSPIRHARGHNGIRRYWPATTGYHHCSI